MLANNYKMLDNSTNSVCVPVCPPQMWSGQEVERSAARADGIDVGGSAAAG